MEATLDSGGRLLVPKAMREALGLGPGSVVDVTIYGSGIHVTPGGRTARLTTEDGILVADSEQEVTDDMVFGLIDAFRR